MTMDSATHVLVKNHVIMKIMSNLDSPAQTTLPQITDLECKSLRSTLKSK